MVKMRLKEVKENIVTYHFQPEFKGKEGILEFIFDGNKIVDYKIIKKSEYRCTSMYIGHCLSLVRKMKEAGEFKEECSAQWY